jgi:transcriptional regulator with XRE-family HTH domain
VKRPHTRETLARNLRALMDMREWTQTEMARRSGVSQRMVSHVLSRSTGCSIETADALAKPFGLTGWHLLIPDLPDELLRSPSLQSLVDAFVHASDSGRAMISMVAEREAKYGNDKDG